jgi:predicted aspartyl protease
MGAFIHPITIVGPNGEETVEALVDTGASFTTMPTSMLNRLGVTPHRQARMRLADGSAAVWDIGRCTSRLAGNEEADLGLFGAEEAPPTIGSHTVQTMLLGVDPVDHRLVPTEGYLL